MCLKTKAFSIHFDIMHQIVYLNSVLLKEEKQGKEEKAFLLKLLSEGRLYCNFIFKLLVVPISVCLGLLSLQ